eukprot:9845183-Ditylum_brightwellii.AAC.1
MTDVGDKIRSMIVKLQEMHGKEKLLMFTEDRKLIQLETILKKINKYYMNKSIFKSSKDTAVCIGHTMNINPFWIDCTQSQESMNLLMEGSAQEKVATNKKGKKIETNALGVYARLNYSNLALDLIQDIAGSIATKSVEQNAYLVNYADS